jgi:hypothetical protein
MKESITKFDLEAAFKALDEIDIPKADKGIKANRPALSEVFSRKSKFDALFEEYYDINNTADLTDAKDERDAEVAMAKLARIEKIVDLDADSPDQLLPSYVGKYIMQCPQCMTLFYKDQEDIEESEEDSTIVNVNEVCQHCGNESGYTLIGKVGAADEEPADLSDGEPEEVDVDSYDETEGEDFDVDVDEYSDEDIDLDFELEDDETAEDISEVEEDEIKEESFYIPSNNTVLTEELEESDLLEDADLEISDDDFKKLISSPEFKKPISDTEVRGMLSELGESKKQEEHSEDSDCLTEAVEEQQFDDTQEDLTEGGLGLLGKTISKKLKQTGQKIKDKASAAIDKFADDSMTREEKADWVLNFALEEHVKEVAVDEQGKLTPNQAGRKYKNFLVFGFKGYYTNGKPITMMPSHEKTSDLVYGMPEPQARGTYKEADDLASGWSQRQGCGPAFIYLANGKDAKEATFLCGYFKGELKNDNLEKYFQIVKKDIEGKEKIEKGGGVDGEASNEEVKTEEVIVAKLQKGDKIVLSDEVCVVTGLTKSKHSPDIITVSLKMEDGTTDTPGFNQNAKVTRLISSSTNESLSKANLSAIMENIDYVSEERLEKFINETLVKTYKNVKNFKITECSYLNESLNIKGIVNLNSGIARKTTYTFNEAIENNSNITLFGYNEMAGKNKQCVLNGSMLNKTLITESFKYNKK